MKSRNISLYLMQSIACIAVINVHGCFFLIFNCDCSTVAINFAHYMLSNKFS